MKTPTLLAVARHRGTEISNPFSSSGESGANSRWPPPITAEDQSLCLVRGKIHRDPVDAVAQMSRWRAVIKDMSKMASAIRAMNLGSDHGEASINGCLDGTLDRIVKAGPAGPRFRTSHLTRIMADYRRRMKTCRVSFPEARRSFTASPSRERALRHTARASESGAIRHR